MKVFAALLALVATTAAQDVAPVPLPGHYAPPAHLEYPPVHPLTQVNAPLDGYYGFNPYATAYGPGIPPQAPFVHPAYSNYLPQPYQVPPQYQYPGYPQFPLVPQLPQLPHPLAAYPHPAFAQQAVPYQTQPQQFVPHPADFPQQFTPQVLPQQQVVAHPALNQQVVPHQNLNQQVVPQQTLSEQVEPIHPQQVTQHVQKPHYSDATTVSYANFQLHQSAPQQVKPVAPSHGVNGVAKPVNTPYKESGSNNNQAGTYGSAYGKYVSAVPAAGQGSIQSAPLPAHELNQKSVNVHAATGTQ